MKEGAEARSRSSGSEHLKAEIERTNAMLRHFRGVAASVLRDAQNVWEEVCEACRDPRTCEQLLEGADEPTEEIPSCGWPELREKLYLLGHYINYTRKLCEGSVDDFTSSKKGG